MADNNINASTNAAAGATAPFPLPRVTIKFCTQCKWNLRAAYFAQELLSTFSTSLGEVALQPSTGGTFIIDIVHATTTTTNPSPLPASSSSSPPLPTSNPAATYSTTTLWNRTTDGGFPETKELKRRVRDVIEPGRNLGHVDRDHARPGAASATAVAPPPPPADKDTTAVPSSRPRDGGDPGSSVAAAAAAATATAAPPAIDVLPVSSQTEKEACEDCN